MERAGFDAVNMVAVAAEAGVSRQTVYTNFGSREELLSQAVARVNEQLLGRIDERLAGTADAAAYVVEFFVAARSEFRRHRLLARLMFPDGGSPVFEAEMFARATPIAERFMAPLFERAPELAERRDDVVEVLIRMSLSVLMFDSAAVHTDDDLRGFLRRVLVPALGL
jgi:AcrR family transcriptional regulator